MGEGGYKRQVRGGLIRLEGGTICQELCVCGRKRISCCVRVAAHGDPPSSHSSSAMNAPSGSVSARPGADSTIAAATPQISARRMVALWPKDPLGSALTGRGWGGGGVFLPAGPSSQSCPCVRVNLCRLRRIAFRDVHMNEHIHEHETRDRFHASHWISRHADFNLDGSRRNGAGFASFAQGGAAPAR